MTIDIVADALAAADAEAQAQFLNNFYRHLKVMCKGREDRQLQYIADCLDENGREFVKELSEFSVLSVETRVRTEQELSSLWDQKRELEREIEQLKTERDGGV